jgi:hypothetical protein
VEAEVEARWRLVTLIPTPAEECCFEPPRRRETPEARHRGFRDIVDVRQAGRKIRMPGAPDFLSTLPRCIVLQGGDSEIWQ